MGSRRYKYLSKKAKVFHPFDSYFIGDSLTARLQMRGARPQGYDISGESEALRTFRNSIHNVSNFVVACFIACLQGGRPPRTACATTFC